LFNDEKSLFGVEMLLFGVEILLFGVERLSSPKLTQKLKTKQEIIVLIPEFYPKLQIVL